MEIVENHYGIIHDDVLAEMGDILTVIDQISKTMIDKSEECVEAVETLKKYEENDIKQNIRIIVDNYAEYAKTKEENYKIKDDVFFIELITKNLTFLKKIKENIVMRFTPFMKTMLEKCKLKYKAGKGIDDFNKINDAKKLAYLKEIADMKAIAEKEAADANADLLLQELNKEEENNLKQLVQQIIQQNPLHPLWTEYPDQKYIGNIESEFLKKSKKLPTNFLSIVKESLKKQRKKQNKRKEEAEKLIVEKNLPSEEPPDELLAGEVVPNNLFEVSGEVTVKKEQVKFSIDELIMENIRPYLELFAILTAEPNTGPHYRNGTLAITCFTKKNRATPNDYVLDIGLHGLWPHPINPTDEERKTDINFENDAIKAEYKKRNPFILQKKSKSRSKKPKKFYTYSYEEGANCLAEEYDYFEHEWIKHGVYASIYENVDDYLKEACELAKPIILIIRYFLKIFPDISFDNIITMINQIPVLSEYFIGGYYFNKSQLPYGKELHFRIVGIPDSDRELKFKWNFGKPYAIYDSGKRKKLSRKWKRSQKKIKKSIKKKSASKKKKLLKRSRLRRSKIKNPSHIIKIQTKK